jgi:hypothetical protein
MIQITAIKIVDQSYGQNYAVYEEVSISATETIDAHLKDFTNESEAKDFADKFNKQLGGSLLINYTSTTHLTKDEEYRLNMKINKND